MTCGIYKITNKTNGKIYIGSSVDIRGRFNSHKSDLRQNKHGNSKLQRAWDKYGEEAFVFDIVEECSPDTVRNVEQQYLDELFLKSDSNTFYNLYGNACGITPEKAREDNLKRWADPEFKAKASASFKKAWSDPELIARHRNACKDSYKNIADIEGWREKHRTAHTTEEYRSKTSERVRSQWSDPEVRSKMVSKINSEEVKARVSKKVKEAFEDKEVKRKHREGIEKSLTPERRADLSKYAKEYFSTPENRHKQCLNSPLRKPVRCKETNTVYDSISHAAKDVGASVKAVKIATKPGRTCRGLTFEYTEK